jgi:hypothetical protein
VPSLFFRHLLIFYVLLQLFRAEVRIVDYAKKNALQKSLLQMITLTAPNEKLEDKLNSMNINPPDASDCA